MNVRSNEQGALNALLIPLVFSVIFFFAALGFGLWAYTERTDYKENVDQKIAAAVDVAVNRAKTEKDNEFLEREKNPLREYKGPATFGSFTMKYPKTWSAYSQEENGKTTVIFHPLVIPAGRDSIYALRVEVVDSTYDKEAARLDSAAKNGDLRVSPYRLPKLSDVLGVRADGEIAEGKRGTAILLPLRDKTMKISTESETYLNDFEKIILANFTFQP